MIIFEQKAQFTLTVPRVKEPDPGAGVNYRQSWQGEKYGCFGGRTNCSAVPGHPRKIPPDK